MKKFTLALISAAVLSSAAVAQTQTVSHTDLALENSLAPHYNSTGYNSAISYEGDVKRADDEPNFGTLTVIGEVLDQTCRIHTDYKHLIVKLPSILKTDVEKENDVAQWKPFEIKLDNCTTATNKTNKAVAVFSAQYADYNLTKNTLKNRLANHTTTEDSNAIDDASAGVAGLKATLLGVGSNKEGFDTAIDTASKTVEIQLTAKDRTPLKLNVVNAPAVAGTVTGQTDGSDDWISKSNNPTKSTTWSTKVFDTDSSYKSSVITVPKETVMEYGAQYFAAKPMADNTPGKIVAYATYNVLYK